jgi:hypothetical protein
MTYSSVKELRLKFVTDHKERCFYTGFKQVLIEVNRTLTYLTKHLSHEPFSLQSLSQETTFRCLSINL